MRLCILDDYAALSLHAANYFKQRLLAFKPTIERPFVLGLPTGSSPMGLYKELVRMVKEGEISFEYVVTFNMDEYVGIEKTHPESYHAFM